MGYIKENYGIYWAKTRDYIMGYMRQPLGDIFGKIWDIFGKNYWKYWAKTLGYFMGYIRLKLWDILGKHYTIYYGIYCLKIVEYIWQNDGIYRSIGYIKKKLSDILVKSHGIYLTKTKVFWLNYGVYYGM